MNRVIATLLLVPFAFAGDPEWPGFRGPSSNPSALNSNLPDKWSKTSNIEWTATLPGLGWSSPIVASRNIFVTTVTTDGKAKQPQVGTDYSNDYAAELQKQGLKDQEIMDRLNARDFELPNEVSLHYFLYSIRAGSVQPRSDAVRPETAKTCTAAVDAALSESRSASVRAPENGGDAVVKIPHTAPAPWPAQTGTPASRGSTA